MVEIASALRNSRHLTAIVEALKMELAALPTEPLLVYLVDDAPPSALYYLARQYGMLGWAGWQLATTDEQRRELIKNAVRLQRIKGTPRAIKEAVATLGFGDVEIRSRVGRYYDGTYLADGAVTASAGNWATFRVNIALPPGVEISPTTADRVIAVINEYKNARSVLADVSWRISFVDEIGGSDIFDPGNGEYIESMTGVAYTDGTHLADGSVIAAAPNDSIEVRILPA